MTTRRRDEPQIAGPRRGTPQPTTVSDPTFHRIEAAAVPGAGLRVTLKHAPGHTADGHLEFPYHFQVPPLETMTWEEAFDHQEYATLRAGTFSRPGGRQLTSVTFSTMFVDFDATQASLHRGTVVQRRHLSWWHKNGLIDPYWMVRELRSLQRTGTPFMLQIGAPEFRDEWDVRMLTTLRSMHVEERAGEPETRYVDVQFSEFREMSFGRKTSRKPTHRSKTRHVTLSIDKKGRHLERGGVSSLRVNDTTLARIAKKAYGEASRWKALAKHNHITCGGSDDLFDYMKRKKLKRLRITLPPEGKLEKKPAGRIGGSEGDVDPSEARTVVASGTAQ